jgi:uncharacterized protein YjbI with pentapeptide repeats
MIRRLKEIAAKNWKTFVIVISSLVIIWAVLRWVIIPLYSVPGTGFADFQKPNADFVRGKTLWDWMDLFIIPIFLGIGVFLLNRSERERESKRAEERASLEREIATDRQQESALQAYLDRMSELLLMEKLRVTKKAAVKDVARTRTLTVLRGLDARRKGMVLLFLYEAGLIEKNPIINLCDSDLSNAYLYLINLKGSNLSGAFLKGANLRGADLKGTNLSSTILTGADLTGASLIDTNLNAADLRGTNLMGAELSGADLRGADLRDGVLRDAKFSEVIYSLATIWPDGLNPQAVGAKLIEEKT